MMISVMDNVVVSVMLIVTGNMMVCVKVKAMVLVAKIDVIVIDMVLYGKQEVGVEWK